jgi:hypothetical protein
VYIKEFELFHGALLTKLVRSEKPLTLRLIETRMDDSWSTYTINDQVRLLVKHSLNPRKLSRVKNGRAWSFVFSKNQVAQATVDGTYITLICGAIKLSSKEASRRAALAVEFLPAVEARMPYRQDTP